MMRQQPAITRNCLREYLAQDHAPKIEFDGKKAGAAEYFDPKYSVDISRPSGLVQHHEKVELRREFYRRAA
jgi:hypothetical protein